MWVIMCAAVSPAEQRGNGREGERWILNANDFAVRDRRGEFSSSSFFSSFFFSFFLSAILQNSSRKPKSTRACSTLGPIAIKMDGLSAAAGGNAPTSTTRHDPL